MRRTMSKGVGTFFPENWFVHPRVLLSYPERARPIVKAEDQLNQ